MSTGMPQGMLAQFIAWRDSGAKSAEQLIELCLATIAEREPRVEAWVEVAPQAPTGQGSLSGIPFGAKDIFETRGMTTSYGSPMYAGRKGDADAALVGDLRALGAVLLGKTHTTAFAYFDPGPTRNPHNPAHTPGGSSSGSAAAVAAGMVPFALGSQTQGSVLRPASFCGVAGFKPSRSVLPIEGVLPFAPSLDTAGFFTATAGDMQLLWRLLGFGHEPRIERRIAVPASLPEVAPEMHRAFHAALDKLRAAGWSIDAIELPARFPDLLTAARLINDYEGARTHEQRWRDHGLRIGAKLAELVERGLRIPASEYEAALARVAELKHEMIPVFHRYPALATPAAAGAAPQGLASTGDPRLNSPWTALGVPAISVPMPVGGALPLGLQLVAGVGSDCAVLALAADVETSLQ